MLDEYRRILLQNQWKIDRTFLAEHIADWLLTEESLTAKLARHCTQFGVSVEAENWTGKEEWLREVILYGDGQAWIFAQTTFSANLMSAYGEEILQLNQTPLGYWLFAKNPRRITTEWAQDLKSGLYARRSQFHLEKGNLTVSELFLENFEFPFKKDAEEK